MPGFDAELYLRLIGERMLPQSARERGHWSAPLDEAGAALVAVGAISSARATAVARDYKLASFLRDPHGPSHVRMRRSRRRRSRARALKFKRVVPLDTMIEDEHGRLELRYALVGDQETSLAITFVPTHDPVTRPRRMGHRHFTTGPTRGLPWGAPAPTLADDRGNTAALMFNGGGGEEWIGRLSTDAPLHATTRWLELDGRRIDLRARPVRTEVCTEKLLQPSPAHGYLWARLAVPMRHEPPETLEPALSALIAAGALAVDDPVIAQVDAVRERLPHHFLQRSGTSGARNLPEPWRSLLRRLGKEDGPSGRMVIGAGTPLFDGHRVGILALESNPEAFSVEAQVSPGEFQGPYDGVSPDAAQPLAWWARDDRGNHYLGAPGSWSSSEDYGQGELNFWPALHPRARRLEILPTAETERAVIAFALEWVGRS